MPWTQVASIAINLIGVVAPLVVVVLKFGTDTSIATTGPDAMKHILVIGLSILFGFMCSLVGSMLLKKGAAPTLADLAKLVGDLQAKSQGSAQGAQT